MTRYKKMNIQQHRISVALLVVALLVTTNPTQAATTGSTFTVTLFADLKPILVADLPPPNGTHGIAYVIDDADCDPLTVDDGIVLCIDTGSAWELVGSGGVVDHGDLTGLGDDDHSQYLHLAGRTGGQQVAGLTTFLERFEGREGTTISSTPADTDIRMEINPGHGFIEHWSTGASLGVLPDLVSLWAGSSGVEVSPGGTNVSGSLSVTGGISGDGSLLTSLDGSQVTTGTVAAPRLGLMTGDSGSGGASGAVPAPGAGDAAAGKYLDAGGTWTVPPDTDTFAGYTPSGNSTTLATATGTLTTGNCVEIDASGNLIDAGAGCGGGSPTFADLASGTNTAAEMVVGSGSTLKISGSGTIAATGIDADGDGIFEVRSTGLDLDSDGVLDVLWDLQSSKARLRSGPSAQGFRFEVPFNREIDFGNPNELTLRVRRFDIQSFSPIRYMAAGTAVSPVLSWAPDSDTGIYLAGVDDLGFSAGGSRVLGLSRAASLNTATVYGGFRIDSSAGGTKPDCSSATEGTLWVAPAVAGVSATSWERCSGDASDPIVYAWEAF